VKRIFGSFCALMILTAVTVVQFPSATGAATALVAKRILLNGKTVTLSTPASWKLSVAATGLHRVRFLTPTPDGRIIATDLKDLSDNAAGALWMLSGLDAKTGKFASVVPFLRNLRNPNSVAFFNEAATATAQARTWLYVALTDQLVRYPWKNGDTAPSGPAQQISRFPDFGKPAKEGGWHLTRTVVVGPDGFVYVSVGSSCDACVENEKERATILRMDPEGKKVDVYATGLRNSVGMVFVGDRLLVTAMGTDHLGLDSPDETVYEIKSKAFYGWPSCYQSKGKVLADPAHPQPGGCDKVPLAITTFAPHSAPLGIARFGADAKDATMRGKYLVALHGSGSPAMKRGYKIVRFAEGGTPEDAVTGFQVGGAKADQRPCGILVWGSDGFLFTDDKGGNVIWVRFGSSL